MTQNNDHPLPNAPYKSVCSHCGQKLPGVVREPLTRRQADALEAIRFTMRARGVAPTYRQLGNKLELRSLSSVWELIQSLVAKGYVRTIPGRRFHIQLID
jgi:repressor LexA